MNDGKVRGWSLAIGIGLLFFLRVVCVSTESKSKNNYWPSTGCSYCNNTGRVECLHCINGRPPGETYPCGACGGSSPRKCPMCGGSGW